MDLSSRIEYCIELAGGAKALSHSVGVSQSQLFRYKKGDSQPSLEFIVKLKEILNVDSHWLLTGEGFPFQNSIIPNIKNYLGLKNSLLFLESILIEYHESVTPERKAALSLLFLLHTENELRHGRNVNYQSHSEKVTIFQFLESFNSILDIDLLAHIYIKLHNNKTIEQEEQTLFASMVHKLHSKLNSSSLAEKYFDRAIYPLNKYNLGMVEYTLEAFHKYYPFDQKIRLLDAGCGNGRHLRYFYDNCDNLECLKGIDHSSLAAELVKQLELQSKLPKNTFTLGDVVSLPFKANSFNLVHSMGVIRCTPILPENVHGVKKVLSETHRVLSDKGIAVFNTLYGKGFKQLPFEQLYDHADIQALASEAGFQVLEIQTHQIAMQKNMAPEAQVPENYRDRVEFILQKK